MHRVFGKSGQGEEGVAGDEFRWWWGCSLWFDAIIAKENNKFSWLQAKKWLNLA
jgi:hypothetical protein